MRFKLQLCGMSVLAFLGCGKNTGSLLADIGSNVNPRAGDKNTYLYWVDGVNAHQGRCTPGEPLIRASCQGDVKSVELAIIRAAVVAPHADRVESLSAVKSDLQAQLAALDEALAQNPSDQDLFAERRDVAIQLEDINDRLEAASAQLSSAQKSVDMLSNNGIVFRLFVGSDRYAAERPYIEQIIAMFNGETPPAPGPAPDSWTDVETGRTFAVVPALMTYHQIAGACGALGGGSWRPISSFTGGGSCSDDIKLARRLFTSPLADSITQTQFGEDSVDPASMRKVVWTRCTYPGASHTAYALGLTSKKELAWYRADMAVKFPTICERTGLN